MKNYLIIFLLLCYSGIGYAQFSTEVKTSQNELILNQEHGYDVPSFNTGIFTQTPGAPQIPYKILSYVIPMDVKVTDVIVTDSDKNTLEGKFYIAPAQPQRKTGNEFKSAFIKPDSAIYRSNSPYPAILVELDDVTYLMGYQVVKIKVYPVQYIPSERKINLFSRISITINYVKDKVPANLPTRISRTRQFTTKEYVRNLIENKEELDRISTGPRKVIDNNDNKKNMQSNIFPFNLGIVPDYIIITTNALKSSFQQLANWETAKGNPALIVTFEDDINGKYPGVDSSEKIRNYLKDITTNPIYGYGQGLFVLLGGDYTIIPVRIANQDPFDGIWKPTDLYYASINGDWNANGNNIFGESTDLVDQTIANFVGRVPVRTSQDVLNYTNKVLEYETLMTQGFNPTAIPSNFLQNTLVIGGTVGGYHTGNNFNSYFSYSFIPTVINLNKWRLYDNPPPGDQALNRLNFLNRLNNVQAYGGYNFVLHCDHSGPYTLGASVEVNNQSLTVPDIDGLTNGSELHILFSNGCDPGRFEKDCIVSHDIRNPNGGAVLAIANAAAGTAGEDYLFGDCLTLLYQNNPTTIVHASDIYANTVVNAYYKRKWELFGDPALSIWSNIPNSPLTVTHSPANLVTGQNNLSLTITGLLSGYVAQVCIMKSNDQVYEVQNVTGTGSPVVVNFSFDNQTMGTLQYTITARQYVPVQGQIPIIANPTASNLYMSSNVINDGPVLGIGNGDHQPDAGETIDFPMTLTNTGAVTATNVTGTLNCTDPNIALVIGGPVNFGTIAPNGTGTSSPHFLFTVSNNMPDKKIVNFGIALSSPLLQNNFNITFHSPVIQINATSFLSTSGQNIIHGNDYVDLTIALYDGGSAVATGIQGTLSTTSTTWIDLMTNSTQSYGDIPSYNSVSNSTPYHFHVVPGYTGQELDFTLTVVNTYGKTWVFPINLTVPMQFNWETSGVWHTGGYTSTNDEISLHWSPYPNFQTSISGYNIYRSSSISGPYSKLTSSVLPGSAFYNDYNLPPLNTLPPLTTYYYEVSGVSLSGVEGPLSDPLKAWTSFPLQPGWPIDFSGLGWRSEGSPMTFDVNGDLEKEIFMSTEDISGTIGSVLGYNNNGTKLFPASASGFYQFDAAVTATPAIADVDQDGKAELLITSRYGANNTSTDQYYTFCFSTIDTDPNTGLPIKKWSSQTGRNLCGDVLADYVNNGSTEVSVKGEWGDPYDVLNGNNGTNYPGWPISGSSPTMSIPVVADLDQSGKKQFIIGVGHDSPGNPDAGIYIWNADGTPYIPSNTDGLFYKNNNSTGDYDKMDGPITVADINNDGKTELICISYEDQTFWDPDPNYPANVYKAHIFVLDQNANCITGWDYNNPNHIFYVTNVSNNNVVWLPGASVGDINHDGHLEVVIAEASEIHAWDYQGNYLPNFPIHVPGLQAERITPLLADVDGDNEVEIVVASNSSMDGKIFGYKLSGDPAVGFPIYTGLVYATPCIDDIDNDGKNEIIACSGTLLNVYKTPGRSSKNLWGKYRLNANNNAVYDINCSYDANNPIIVSTNQTWTNEKYVNSDIEIEPGVTLTVRGTVYMTPQSKVIVKNGNGSTYGGTLLINGGKFTSTCTDFWLGIEAWGQSNQRQNPLYQSRVSITNNGEVDNALIGVLSGKRSGNGFDDSYSGGIIYATSGTFQDNGIAIEIRPYYQFPSTPIITHCQFLTTPFIFDINQFNSFIKVSDVTYVGVYGCSFNNTYSSDPHGIGIYVTEAGIFANAWCSDNTSPCPPQYLVHSTFNNLQRGIYALNSPGTHSSSISRCDFTAVQNGVYLSGYTGTVFVLNTFNVPEPGGATITYPGSYGLYLDGCNQYQVEGNVFQSTAATPSSVGLVVNNSGEYANVIYRNTFVDLQCNTLAQNTNRVSTDYTGLCYVCNTFKTPSLPTPYHGVAIGITYTGNYKPNYGIAEYQNAIFGGNTIPPLNLFHNNPLPNTTPYYYDIYDQCSPILQYHYPTNYNQPMGYSYRVFQYSTNVNPTSFGFTPSNDCPDMINYGGIGTQTKPIIIDPTNGNGYGSINIDSLANSYRLKNNLGSYYELAFLYLKNDELSQAQDVVNEIPQMFPLSPNDQYDYQSFIYLFNLLKDSRSSKINGLTLSEDRISELKKISESCHNALGAYARNILITANKINYIEPIVFPTFEDQKQNNELGENVIHNSGGYLTVYPNPASEYIMVNYDLSTKQGSTALLKVYSSLGELMLNEPLTMEKNKKTIKTENWPSGLYLVTLEIDNAVTESYKISIVK